MGKIVNLVFEGGGVKGIAYVGALRVLDQKGYLKNVEKVAGTSAGAITALLLGVGFSVEECDALLRKTDFKDFQDSSLLTSDSSALANGYGIYLGKKLYQWFQERVAEKFEGKKLATFADLMEKRAEQNHDPEWELRSDKYRALYFTGVNLNTHYLEIFSYETTPTMPLADAARISMSIPFVFAPFKLNDHLYVDGGVHLNFPVKLFDKDNLANLETLGLKVDTAEEIAVLRDKKKPNQVKAHQINNLIGFVKANISTILNNETNALVNAGEDLRTVYINSLDVGTTDFGLSKEKMDALVNEGRKAMEYFLQSYGYRWRLEHPVKRTKDKLERLAKHERRTLFQKAQGVFFTSPEYMGNNDLAKIQWVFKSDHPLKLGQKMRKYFDRLQQQTAMDLVDASEMVTVNGQKAWVLTALGQPVLSQEAHKWQAKYQLPLQEAVSEKRLVRKLLWRRQDDLFNDQDAYLLYDAAKDNKAGILQTLIARRVSVSYQDEQGNTALHVAARAGHKPVLIQLIESNLIKIDVENHYGDTPLHLALQFGRYEAATTLISKGAAVNATNKFGNTPLFSLLNNLQLEEAEKQQCLNLLKQYGADFNHRNLESLTANEFVEKYNALLIEEAVVAQAEAPQPRV